MATASDVLTRMKINCYYRVCDIAAQLRGSSIEDVRRILKLLEKGGLIEVVNDDGYRRKKIYTTKQRCFNFEQ